MDGFLLSHIHHYCIGKIKTQINPFFADGVEGEWLFKAELLIIS
jgi:hypothetical protein